MDTNRVPAGLKRAYTLIAERAAAAGNPSGFISKLQRHEAKERVRRELDDELRSGKHRRSKLVPILWDVAGGILYSPANRNVFDLLAEIFERSLGLSLLPLTAGSSASRFFDVAGLRRDYEDLRPTQFVTGPEGSQVKPEYPWVAKGQEPKDFLGNEFLLWLWFKTATDGGPIRTVTDNGQFSRPIDVMFDRSLDLECAYGQSGTDGFRADGPERTAEAMAGLKIGKLPRKAGLIIGVNGDVFSAKFDPEQMSFQAVKMPSIEDADDARTLFDERISLLQNLCGGMEELYKTFLRLRVSSSWATTVPGIGKWARGEAAV